MTAPYRMPAVLLLGLALLCSSCVADPEPGPAQGACTGERCTQELDLGTPDSGTPELDTPDSGTPVQPGPLALDVEGFLYTTESFLAVLRFIPSGGVPPYTLRPVEPLPEGLEVSNYEDGVVLGQVATPGAYPIAMEVTDSASPPATVRAERTLTVRVLLRFAGPGLVAYAREGQPYREQLYGLGCIGRCRFRTYTTGYKIPGQLPPPGLSLSEDGVLSGTPAPGTAGEHPVSLLLGDEDGQDMWGTNWVRLVIYPAAPPDLTLQLTSLGVPSARVGEAYRARLQYEGASGALRWRVAAGALPAGITLDAQTGELSGLPEVAGTARFVIEVADDRSSTFHTYDLWVHD